MFRSRATAAVALMVVASLTLGSGTVSAQTRIRSGFNEEFGRGRSGRPVTNFACPSVPPPVVDMSNFLTRYDLKDPTQSKVDPARAAAAAGREKQMQAFGTQLARTADLYLTSRPPNPAIAQCVWTHLAAWADADALFENVDQNERLGRRLVLMMHAWQLSTYAAAVLKVSDGRDPPQSEASRKAIAWMRRLLASAREPTREPNPWMRLSANHLYWVGVSAAFMASLDQDQEMKAFAIDTLINGLDDVAENGSLRGEMRRGGRALMYQQFATLPLSILMRFAEANDVALTPSQRQAVLRLVDFSASAATNPDMVKAITGVTQEADHNRSALAWIDVALPYVARLDPALAAKLTAAADERKVSPAWHIYVGGAVTAVYDPKRLPPPL